MDLNLYFDLSVSPDNLYQKNDKIETGEHGISKIGEEYFVSTFHLKGGGSGTTSVAKGDVLSWIKNGGEEEIWSQLKRKAQENNWPSIKYVDNRKTQKYSLLEVYKLFKNQTDSLDSIKKTVVIPDRELAFSEYSNSELANEIELFFSSEYFSKRLQIAHIRMIIEWQFKIFFTEKFINSDETKNEILKTLFFPLEDIFTSWQLADVLNPLSSTFKRKRVFMNGQLKEHRNLGNYFIHFSNEDKTISNLTNDEDKYTIMVDEAKNTIKNLYHIYKEITTKIDFDLHKLINERKKK